ncbi:UPF0182 family membrane protein [Mogibacterium sp.]|uniref:UPF0182 family membrane protein n=1 Tax=Mogibacterium sp. TaxID=2049035 RepID=UPI0025F663A9|nr:UPF0182 family protein [Mogibacterium sp.]
MKKRDKKPKGMNRIHRPKKGLSFVVMVIVVILVLLIGCAGFLTNWMWFDSLGYEKVFWTKFLSQLEIGVPVFLAAMLLVRIYLKSLKKHYFIEIESHEIPDEKRLNKISWGMSVVFGLLVGLTAGASTWMDFRQFANATSFGLKDPLFHLDISFYVFKLSFLTKANNIVLGIVVGVVIITLLYYGILMMVRTPDMFEWEPEEPEDPETSGENAIPFTRKSRKKPSEKRTLDLNNSNMSQLLHIASGKLTLLGIIFYVMVAMDFLMRQFDLLHVHTGAVYGAGFTDVNVKLWVYRLIMALSIVGAVTLCHHMHRKEPKKLVRIPIAIVAVGLLGGVVSFAVQNLLVSPDEINKESKYLERNISFTRHAYGLDNIKVEEFPAEQNLNRQAIRDNSQTITNIRINDYEPVQDFYNQTQSIRQYYDFNDVDIDRYNINGEQTQTYLAAREINESKISSTWINRHLKYTHGYGAAVSRVDAVTASGQPDIIVKNIPPESEAKDIEITRPEIYFGELTNDYVIVNTDEQEFDYPNGNENSYSMYKGKAGIKLNLLNRILFSVREGSMKLLVSSNVNSDSRIIINRNIKDRVEKLMPYLSYEKDPYMTVVNGKLYWIVDAYTTSSYYPYSEPYSGEVGSTNYIRNSVKVVVDAYNGDTTFYVVDEDDPVARTYQKIYPTLFKDGKDMPEGIRKHIRYPNSLLKIQAGVYTKYHMDQVKVFYQDEDLWDIAHQIYGTEEKEMNPSYFIFELPDEKKAEFINMIPFTPKSKQNMTAIMMARNDGNRYGQLLVYKFPKNKTVYGPMQIEAQIDQNTEISKEFSLWNSSGSKYRRGDLFVIPINHSIMYVEPVYLEASNQAIPEMKRVIVAYGDKIAYESTLEDALADLFGEDENSGQSQSASASSGKKNSGKSNTKELIQKANEAYENAVNAQKSGNWKKYGDYLDELEKYLNQLEDQN